MSELQNRRYKEVSPEETVEKLKGLLKKLGIEVEEKWIDESSVGTYSLRICIKDTNIGQNGKGMTREFAMASGYAEFFERFQNGMFRFRIEKPTKEIPFSYAPDEKILSVEELMKDKNSFLENIVLENKKESTTKEQQIEYINHVLNRDSSIVPKENYLSLPYYSIKNDKIEYIPERLFSYTCNTNGMCAGNSREEALIEGLSEIYERYVGIKIFKEKVALPEIPESYLDKFPKVKNMVQKLKKNDKYYFRLVDCSFGGKYPVAGLYIIEKNTGRFGFKLGAHPDYGIAMERCFTEASQGRDIYEYAQTCLFDFYDGEDSKRRNFTEFIFGDFSAVPYQIIGDKLDYEFTEMPDISELDNKEILKGMVKSILADGKDILIRDVTCLGFPTLRIVIPGMSEISFDNTATYFNIFVIMQSLMQDLKNINKSNLKDVINMMETITNEIGYSELTPIISLKDNSLLPGASIGSEGKYLLAILYIMDKQYNKAAKLLEDLSFLTDNISKNQMEKIMIKAVYYYASAMDKLKDHNESMKYINLLFDKEIAEGIDNSFKDEEKILVNHYRITEDDYVDNDDSFYMPFMEKFRKLQKDNAVNQIENRELFK